MGAMWALLIPNVNFPDAEIWVLFVHHFKTVEGFKVASKEVNKVINNDSPDTPIKDGYYTIVREQSCVSKINYYQKLCIKRRLHRLCKTCRTAAMIDEQLFSS